MSALDQKDKTLRFIQERKNRKKRLQEKRRLAVRLDMMRMDMQRATEDMASKAKSPLRVFG